MGDKVITAVNYNSSGMKKPKHIGFIMDGNRRWARSRGLPVFEGHRRGYTKVLKLVDWSIEAGIPVISIYALSTENMKRSKKEVDFIMDLARLVFAKHIDELYQKGVKMIISGLKDNLAPDIVELKTKAERKTEANKKIILQICFNYGGRAEIVEAVKKIIEQKILSAKIDEKLIDKYMFHQLPDPDIIVRTGGEKRLSNFLTWQSVYSELIFLKKYWPAFSKSDFDNILKEFFRRQRRYGK